MDDSEHQPERSDAGSLIVEEVFGFVKELIRSEAEANLPRARIGVRGKGGRSLSPPQH